MSWKYPARNSLTVLLVFGFFMLATPAAADLETVGIDVPGVGSVSAVLARPEEGPAPALLLIHEWWGLNHQIKAAAQEFARAGYLALAVDLYGGRVATEAKDAQALSGGIDPEKAIATLAAWMDWLRGHPEGNGRLATIGWCFGGAWSLNASITAPADATIVYYGSVARKAEDLSRLAGPVLGHFATRDQRINRPMVDAFTGEMDKAGKSLETHWYEAEHAFANPGGARYDEASSRLSWTRSLEFLEKHLH